ncbi:MAG: quinolinate synthase NadA [Bacteroidetes bacterium]|nr:quinolinate synthase NadA [Bacteroidota bacterium]
MNDKFIKKYSSMTGSSNTAYIEKLLPLIEEIKELKKKHNAVVLSHYYMTPELQIEEKEGGIADFVGDSLGLSVAATKTDADYIVFCGVKFMAETAFILNPKKTVLLPDDDAGCSLAESITGDDVIKLKSKYPGIPVIAYINTYAETKAECDVCCTSRNAIKIAKSFESKELIFIPDQFMGQNLAVKFATETDKKLILWSGTCEVHEQFRTNIESLTLANPGAELLLHWEVPQETVESTLKNNKGIVGSTSDILNYVENSKSREFILGSECDLGATLKGMYPDRQFITPCIMCRHMKLITLQKTLDALRSINTETEIKYKIKVDEPVLSKAYIPIKRMLDLS